MRLTHGSCLVNLLYGKRWPPERMLSIGEDGGSITVRFQDPWVPFEAPILPFGLDREGIWRARYQEESKRWSLVRERDVDLSRDVAA